MIILHDEQGSPGWFAGRAGVHTASNFMESRKRMKSGAHKGEHSTAAKNMAFKKAVERIKGAACDEDQYETWAMRRGTELEHDARLLHERRKGVFIEQASVILTDDRRFGYSTDGFIGDDGMAEYKCFVDPSKVREIMFADDASDVMDQVQGGMWITGRSWCDFCLYYPDLESIGLNLIVNRIERDDEYIEGLVEDLLAFDTLIENYMDRIQALAGISTAPSFEEINIAEEVSLEDIF